jgi:UDP:flavonoid glycosyltransferase YjiC (YdhE family)
MRVVFTCLSATGHLHPLVPVARALADAGHDVRFAADAAIKPMVERAGFRHVQAGINFGAPEARPLMEAAMAKTGSEHEEFVMRRGFGGLLAERMAADLLALPEVRSADLLVRDCTEFGAAVAAERLDIPHAAVSIVAAGFQPRWREWLAEPLGALRAAHGLPADPEAVMPFRYLTLHPFPPSFLGPIRYPTDHAIRPAPFDRSGDEALPAWIDELPADRPTVYATLGTVFNGRADLFAAFLAGLRDEPVNLILTVGRDQDPAQFGAQPPNVRIERYVPQSLVFSRCDAVLTHGGSGTIVAALAHGLPLVVVPISADQPQNAARAEALGVGRAVEPVGLTPDAVRDAVRAVLGDPAYRRNAERLRAEIAWLPGPSRAVALLERLAAERRPLLAAA